jgi:hypothetical protein
MRSGERVKLVLLEKVVDTHAEELSDNTDMIAMVESLDQVDAFPVAAGELQGRYRGYGRSCQYVLSISRVAVLEELEDADLNVRGLTVLWDGTDNLHSDFSLAGEVCGLDDLAKGALTEKAHDAIWHEGRGVRRGTSVSLETHIDRQ